MPEPNSLSQFTAVLQTVAAWGTSITIILAALSAIFKPLRNLLAKLGHRLWGMKDKQKELLNSIDDIEKKLSKQIKEVGERVDKSEIKRIRSQVLTFAGECRRGIPHTKEAYEDIIESNAVYEELLEKTGGKNGVYKFDYEYITHCYQRDLEENSFLV